MSCVADAKATSTNSTSSTVIVQNGRQNAITASTATIVNCVSSIHQRLLRKMSMKGLQRGLMSQGRLMRVVSGPKVPLSTPRSLKTARAMVLTIA